MLVYLLKSAACLAILLAFYKLLMERESMHTLKRFFLLGALVAALAIPFITFVEYVEVPIPTEVVSYEAINVPVVGSTIQESAPINYLSIVLWSVYVLGAVLFGLKFAGNLVKIIQRIRKNPKYTIGRITRVLMGKSITPHTFLNYIFLNKKKFEAQQIPEEVLLHEETHARQKHSWDVLFVELLQVLFWFNPLIHLTKRAIKLNHEFLADRAVLDKGIQPATYLNTLLEFSSNSLRPSLANAINYSSIKKRFTVMKKQTSRNFKLVLSALLLPLLGILLYGFSETKTIETFQKYPQSSIGHIEDSQTDLTDKDHYYNKVTFKFRDENGNVNRQAKYEELTLEEKANLLPPPTPILPAKKPSQNNLNNWKDANKFGVWVDGNRIDNSKLSTYKPEDFGTYHISKLAKNAKNYGKHFFQINLYTNDAYKRQIQESSLPLDEGVVINFPYTDKNESTSNSELRTTASKIEKDSINFIKDWFITIDHKKYYYLRDNKRIWHYYNSDKKEVKLDIVAAYKRKNKAYNAALNKGVHYVHRSKSDQTILDMLASDLGGMYFRMSRVDKSKVKRPISRYAPYIKFVKDGKTVFKKQGELTEEDKKSLPSPPPNDMVIIYNKLVNTIKVNPKSRLANLNYLRKIHSEMNSDQKSKVEHPDLVLKSISQEGATKEQLKEYNSLAKKYNAMSKDNFRVIGKEVNRLKYIYSIMSVSQKEDAQPYPNFPPPPAQPSPPTVFKGEKSNIPPPPPPFKVPKKGEGYSEELLKAFDTFSEKGDSYGKAVSDYKKKGKGNPKKLQQMYDEVMELYDHYMDLAVKENLMPSNPKKAPKVKVGEKSTIPPPPPPSAPKEPESGAGNLPASTSVFSVPSKVHENAENVINGIINNQEIIVEESRYNKPPSALSLVGGYLPANSTPSSTTTLNNRALSSPKFIFEASSKTIHSAKMNKIQPPPPPAAKSPLEHIQEMADQNALFYFEKKKISAKKAMEIYKTSKKISLLTRHEGLKRPIVELSHSPIVIEQDR